MNSRSIAPSSQPARVAFAIALVALVPAMCVLCRGPLALFASSTVGLPIACIAGAAFVRAVEWLFATALRLPSVSAAGSRSPSPTRAA
jgi:hypothetical protein